MDKLDIINKLKQQFEDEEHVWFAYLFGSFASGKNRAGSDVDIAVYFSPELNKLQRFDIRLKLMDRLAATLLCEVDLVDLASSPLSLRHQIMLGGELIMEKNKRERVSFEVNTRREYFDISRHLDRRTDAIISRL